MDRRSFLLRSMAATGAAGLASETGLGIARAETRTSRVQPGRARGVVFMVADGMSTGTLTLAEVVKQRRDGIGTRWVSMWGKEGVRRASAWTHAADSIVTDSSAGASAWGIGRKVNNGAVNMTPDGETHEPILVTAKRAGMLTGVVTTTRVTHATPAGFYANAPQRGMEREIAGQLLERRIDVALGGGARYFGVDTLADHKDVRVVQNAAELADAPLEAGSGDGRLLGVFAKDHVPWTLDRTPETPSLAAMTRAALERLTRSDRGFVLQVEGGRVDHAAHDNDAGSLIAEQLDFDEAIGTVLEFVERDPSILVIVTTDHANGNPGLTLYNRAGSDGIDRLMAVQHSFSWISKRLNAIEETARSDAFPEIVREATGITLERDEMEMVLRAMRKERVDPFGPANSGTLVLGSVLANHFGVAFLSPNHTADMVEVTALGPGAERIGPAIDNTDLHRVMRESLAI